MNTSQDAGIAASRAIGYQIIKSKLAPVIFALTVNPDTGKCHLKAWRGKSPKVAFFYSFRSFAAAEKYAVEYVEKVRKSEEITAARKAEKKAARASLKASDHWMVGDAVYTSWGYDQTNVEFFQIVKLKPKSVIVRQCKVNSSDHGQPGGGKVAPRRFEMFGPEILCPLNETGGFSAGPCWGKDKPSYRNHCRKWDGRAVYTSSDR